MRAIAARRVVLSEDPLSGPGDDGLVRAQAAGGPDDIATYCCSCGFVFCASVSTTVACPHCGADQAW